MSPAAGIAAPPVERLSFAGLAVLALGSLDMSLEQSLILPALPALAHHGADLMGLNLSCGRYWAACS